ncbi:MAG: hypothetical protein A2511_12930 [Deltaproteobacteria bacterium RIFOXYD12_FULL_50_9]|nr:MAG: hypothetical protein A2511_12930 [Deltaproteobacteria bacterium RIFOXYD12_FULL_50_9]
MRHSKSWKDNSIRNRTNARSNFVRKVLINIAVGSVVVISLGLLGVFGIQTLSSSEIFRISAIEVEGVSRTSKEEILRVSGVDTQTNLLAMQSAVVRDRVAGLAWIEQVEVKKAWPSRSLIIKVKERQPIAMINLADGLYFVDKNGVAFARVHTADYRDFPVISGAEERVNMAGQTGAYIPAIGKVPDAKKEAVAEALLYIISAGQINSTLPKQNISQIHISPGDELVLFMADRPIPVYLGRGDVKKRYARLVAVLRSIYQKREYGSVAYIRMNYRGENVLVGQS